MVKYSSPNAPSTSLIFLWPHTHAKTSESLTFIRKVKKERTVAWWNTAAETRPVLHSSSFDPVPTLKRQNLLLSNVRDIKHTLNVHCSVQYTLIFLYLMLVTYYCASNRNKYQEYFLGGEGGWCVGLTTLPPSYADCLKIWESQPPGTLRACQGL
jgi:hypothetical protein